MHVPPAQAFQFLHEDGESSTTTRTTGNNATNTKSKGTPTTAVITEENDHLTDWVPKSTSTSDGDTEMGQKSSRNDDPAVVSNNTPASNNDPAETTTATVASLEMEEPSETEEDDTFPKNEATTPDKNTNSQQTVLSDSSSYSRLHVIIIFLVASLNGLLYGYDLSATSFVLQAWMDDEQGSMDDDENADQEETEDTGDETTSWTSSVASSTVWIGLLLAMSSIGAFLACSFFSCVSSHHQAAGVPNTNSRPGSSIMASIGRRTELQLAGLLYAVGAALETSAGFGRILESSSSAGLAIFVTGRLLYGCGMGVAMHAAPTYLSEMSPSTVRGLLLSLKEAVIVLGMVVGYSLGALWHSMQSWPYVYAVTIPPAMLSLAVTAIIPESGRWLLWKGRIDEALKAIQFIYPDPLVAYRHFQSIQQSILHEEHELLGGDQSSINVATRRQRPSLVAWMIDPHYRLPLRAGLGLVILQQITGQPTILSYAAQVLQDAGISSSAVIYVGVVKLAATFVAVATVEHFGRLPLLYTGTSMMLIALVLLAFAFQSAGANLLEDAVSDMGFFSTLFHPQTIVMVAMFLYFGAFQIGFGPITWLIVGEIYPLAIRTQAVALSVQLNFLFNAVVQFGVPILADWVGLATIFCCFALLAMYRYVLGIVYGIDWLY